MAKLTISVVLCTFNGERFLEEQLLSIFNQAVPLKEVIVFDDASTDNTAVILATYAAKYPALRFYINPINLGFSKNFEQALTAADADVVAISDQDDIWSPDKLTQMMQHWPAASPLIYCNSARFTGSPANPEEPNPGYRRFEGTNPRKLSVFNTISGHAILVRKSFLPLVLPLDNEVMYDWWMGVVAACNGGVTYLPQTLVYQRVHANNATVDQGYEYSTKGPGKRQYKQRVEKHLRRCLQTPGMSASDQAFFQQLHRLWYQGLKQKFSWPLFFFIIKNRTEIFWFKKKKNPFFSYLKHTCLLAGN